MNVGKKQLRSGAWFGPTDKNGFIHCDWTRNQGFPGDVFDDRPVIGNCNTWSRLTPCNAHLRQLAEGGSGVCGIEHVMQVPEGADLDFLVGCRSMTVARESH